MLRSVCLISILIKVRVYEIAALEIRNQNHDRKFCKLLFKVSEFGNSRAIQIVEFDDRGFENFDYKFF